VIRDLSETLKAILTQPGLPAELAAAHVSFDRPGETFTPAQPTVNLFLFDIRENGELRINEPVIRRKNGMAHTEPPPRRINCSYLVTAWPVGGQDLVWQEHRLLTQVLQVLSRYSVVPADLAVGTIKTSDPPVPLSVAIAGTPTNLSEFWTSLGGKLRASVTVQATISLPMAAPPEDFLAITHVLRTGERQPFPVTKLVPGSAEEGFTVFGQVLGTPLKPAAGARVEVIENGQSTTAGDDGSFRLGPMPKGTYTLRATTTLGTGQIQRDVPVQGGNYDIQLA
jgi:hypothetical protein